MRKKRWQARVIAAALCVGLVVSPVQGSFSEAYAGVEEKEAGTAEKEKEAEASEEKDAGKAGDAETGREFTGKGFGTSKNEGDSSSEDGEQGTGSSEVRAGNSGTEEGTGSTEGSESTGKEEGSGDIGTDSDKEAEDSGSADKDSEGSKDDGKEETGAGSGKEETGGEEAGKDGSEEGTADKGQTGDGAIGENGSADTGKNDSTGKNDNAGDKDTETEKDQTGEPEKDGSESAGKKEEGDKLPPAKNELTDQKEEEKKSEEEEETGLRERAENEVFQIDGQEGYYKTLQEAVNALTEDGQTITLLEDANIDGLSSSGSTDKIKHSFTLTAENDATLTTGEIELVSNSDTDVRDVRFENITINVTGNRDSIQVGKNIHLTLGDGATLSNETGTVIQGEYIGITATDQVGLLTMESGSLIKDSKKGIASGSPYTDLNIIMEEGSEISGCKQGMVINGPNVYPFSVEIRGRIVNNVWDNTRSIGGLVCQGGDIHISGNAQIIGNMTTNKAGEEVPGNISLGKNVVLDLTDLDEDANLGLTIPNAKPTGDNPVLLAELNPDWTELPEGITLDDENSPYQLSLGTSKLETGRLYLIDPDSRPSNVLDGNGTESDPFCITTYEELKAAVEKANRRSAMTYVRVDDAIEFPENEKLLLSGKLNLYSDDPESTAISTPYNMFYITGKAEIVLHDIHLQGLGFPNKETAAILHDTSDPIPTGKITIEKGTVIEGFVDTEKWQNKTSAILLEKWPVDIIMTGGEIRNCDNAFLTEGKIDLQGGSLSDLDRVTNLAYVETAVKIGSSVKFANNEQDFIIGQASRNLMLTGPLGNELKLKLDEEAMTGEVLTAEDASYLEGWEDKITVSDGRGNSYNLKRSEDGKQLLLQGGETAINFERSEIEGKYYSYDFDTQKRVDTGTSFTGAKGVSFTYNGYGLSLDITQAKLSEQIDGLTNEDGYITNWESPNLELRASVGGELVKTTISRDGKISIDGIPANFGKQPKIYLYYTGNDIYSSASADVITFDTFANFRVLTGVNQKIDKLDLTSIVNSSVPYTGEEAFPNGAITVEDPNLKGGKTVTLKFGEDYQFKPIKGKNCTDAGEAYAAIWFIGNYSEKNYYYEVKYTISQTVGSLEIEDYKQVVQKGDTSEQTINLSELQITPAQASYTYALDEISDENKAKYFAADGVPAINGSELTFKLNAEIPTEEEDVTKVTIPVKVDSPNASGTAKIVVTITEKTSGAVELRQGGITDEGIFFNSLTEAWPYVKEGGNPVIIITREASADGLTLDKPVTIFGKEPDSTEPADQVGSLTGSITLADPNIVIQNTDLSKATIKLATEGKEIQYLTENYWGEDGPYEALKNKEGLKGISRDKVFPYYRDASMTQSVEDPKEYFEDAIGQANALIESGKLDKLISLLDLQDKKDDPEVESFLWSKQEQLRKIVEELKEADESNQGELKRYLKYNKRAEKEYGMLLWAYNVSCKVITESSTPDAEGAGSNAQTEAGRTAVETAMQELAENSAVKDYLPALSEKDGPEVIWDAVKKAAGADADKIEAIYLKVAVSAKQITVDESLETPKLSKLQFEVEAQYKTRTSDETKKDLEGKAWAPLPEGAAKEVTFRLPIPSSVTEGLAVVKQDGMADRELEIKEENGAKYVELTVSKFGSLDVTFKEKSTEEKPDQETDRSSGSSSGGSVTIRNNGTWHQDNVGWWFAKTGGGYPADQWYECYWNGQMKWYHFNAQGYLDAGWFTDKDGATYYLHNQHDNHFGYMYTGWNWIDGKCYYFTPNTIAGGPKQGMLYQNGITPDGYSVNETGAWTVNGAVQTR